jgi:hypothetical protein
VVARKLYNGRIADGNSTFIIFIPESERDTMQPQKGKGEKTHGIIR